MWLQKLDAGLCTVLERTELRHRAANKFYFSSTTTTVTTKANERQISSLLAPNFHGPVACPSVASFLRAPHPVSVVWAIGMYWRSFAVTCTAARSDFRLPLVGSFKSSEEVIDFRLGFFPLFSLIHTENDKYRSWVTRESKAPRTMPQAMLGDRALCKFN